MNISHSIPATVGSISFSFLTTEDIRRISVKQIVNPVLLDDLNRPNTGGLYDPALGPSDKQDICATCRLSYFTCPGHFGHIELPAPVFHPLFMGKMYDLLRGTCLYCHTFKATRFVICKFAAKLRLLEHGFLLAAKSLDDFHVSTQKKKGKLEEENDDEPEESFVDYEKRINAYVALHLASASSSKRDSYKDTQVYEERRQVIHEFMKTIIGKKCRNPACGAHAYTFRKEGHTKIIEYDLPAKQKAQNNFLGLKRPNVLLDQGRNLDKAATGEYTSRPDGDIAMESDSESDSESEGEDVFSDNDEGQDLHAGNNSSNLPKSASGKVKTSKGRNERVVAPEECRAHLRRLFAKEVVMCALLFGRHGPFSPLSPHGLAYASADIFFLDVIPVSPTRFRPPAKMNDMLFEHPQNELLARVLTTSYRLRDLNENLRAASEKSSGADESTKRKLLQSLLDSLIQLQVDVNSFIDSSKNPQPVRQGKLPPAGVKQLLEKKEGLFRKHMMGKRVNYAARSVISPDVNIEPNEIGIPPVFARKLTFPEPVTPANFHELRALVITGPHGYPGATMVEYEDGHLQFLEKMSLEQRTAIANQLLTPQDGDRGSARSTLRTRTPAINKKVYRHLRDGDQLILNRQPTLHKPSMMVHRARVLQGEKTIRMHYANCNSYNADFDGDEMNIHFPQNQVARAEAMFIANTDNQYLVPTSGKPLRGLIQDHVVAGVWMTAQDTFFTREEYFQLLYGALRPESESGHYSGRLVTLPPTIWKPRPLWTGKQIISTVMLNITPSDAEGLNLNAKAKVPGQLWGKDSSEDKVVFMDGELLCGVLDKSAFGATDFGLVHSVYELYGADVAGRLLGILSRLFTKFLQHRAFTCRMDDLALTPQGNAKRKQLIQDGANLGTAGAIENFPSLSEVPEGEQTAALRDLLEDVLRDDSKMAALDMTVKSRLAKLTKSIADAVIPHGLLRKFPHNHMQAMTQSGAKGSAVNAQQISCALGQQELEGRRVPVMVSGKTLPSFKPFETKAIAGGYVASRFLTGVKPQEFFFHCMAGREGLIDTAVKTSRSGYLQRCLIKHLEGIRVHYDNTVRGSDSSVYQFHYGGDALDVTRQKHLYQFDFLAQNFLSLARRNKLLDILEVVDQNEAPEHMKMVLKQKRKRSEGWPDPTISRFNPSRYCGSTSEKFAEKVEEYAKTLKAEKHGLPVKRRRPLLNAKQFRRMMWAKYMRSLVDPGEAVGLLASQGVGEPSTQMTLNTFHFAGHGAANVTLGIPRLREIVMTASRKPKTPSMNMLVRQGITPDDIDTFCKRASRLTLSQVVDKVIVKETLVADGTARSKTFTIELVFYPAAEYRTEYDIEPSEILSSFGTKFPLILKREIQNELKKLDQDLKSQMANVGRGKAVRDQAGDANARGDDDAEDDGDNTRRPNRADDDDTSEIGDGDATAAKRQRQSKEQATYGDDDEDEDEDERFLKAFDDDEIEAAYASAGEESEADDPKMKTSTSDLTKEAGTIKQLFMENFSYTTSFSFNEAGCSIGLQFGSEMPKLLLVGIVEKTCIKTVVREIPGITDCFKGKEDKNGVIKYRLSTNGSNIPGLWQFACSDADSLIDENSIYSNDIYAILTSYGVEAARAAILREVSGVFDVYKIDVDSRHLELIADYMTFDGGYKPFNRSGISTNPSPLLKASYETTASFLSDATLHGDFDDLTTPSGNIVAGRLSLTGTGVFDIVTPIESSV